MPNKEIAKSADDFIARIFKSEKIEKGDGEKKCDVSKMKADKMAEMKKLQKQIDELKADKMDDELEDDAADEIEAEDFEEMHEAEAEKKEVKKVKKSQEEDAASSLVKSFDALASRIEAMDARLNKMGQQSVRKAVRPGEVLEKGSSSEDSIRKSEPNLNVIDDLKTRAQVADVLAEDGIRKGLLTPQEVAVFELSGKLSGRSTAVAKSLLKGRFVGSDLA